MKALDYIKGRMATLTAALLASTASAVDPTRAVPTYRGSTPYGRGRYPGKAQPAGMKLVRKAREGTVGLARLK